MRQFKWIDWNLQKIAIHALRRRSSLSLPTDGSCPAARPHGSLARASPRHNRGVGGRIIGEFSPITTASRWRTARHRANEWKNGPHRLSRRLPLVLPLLFRRLLNPHSVLRRLDRAPQGTRPFLDQFGAVKEYPARIVNPEQDHDEGTGGAVSRGGCSICEIKRLKVLADLEENGGDYRAEEHVVPVEPHVREDAEEHAEECRNHDGGGDEIDRYRDPAGFPHDVLADHGQGHANNLGDQQQEIDDEHHAQREEA